MPGDLEPLDHDAVLIVIDVQQGFRDPSRGPRDNPRALARIAALVDAWTGAGRPVVRVRHASTTPTSSLSPGSPGYAFEPFVAEIDPSLDVVKQVHSAFGGDVDLHAWLTNRGIRQVVVCGIQTNMCCETTSRVAGDLGYEVVFAHDATHTFDQVDPATGQVVPAWQLALATRSNLANGFATVGRHRGRPRGGRGRGAALRG
ncbi:cysteine hydrolase family protein [Cellulomonas chengniuliangii]|uniref:Cysteine hydrolase n=1 Tax=Cellulomonas chengniuliangii TaxID=2968084 RepID=A0ABY5L129_9CELL|nr:cysteine hydrolase family protein [Cellulomonas chengniuliangii]MCC2307093.1 cysteine hydrolase [Cellulomonas chengniuliangii]UUI76109.1 cysteine hydrolase [Cellulomonas chengniuliangii]